MTHDIEGLSEVFRLLGEPNRLRILLSLGLECRPVSAVIAATGLSQANGSFHLRTLPHA
jgi:DNA-binding transcriptional ArsR family regulator